MRSILFSTALVFAAVMSSGCATICMDKGCGVDGQAAATSDCCQGNATGECCKGSRVGGLIGRLRGEGSCVDCGNGNCPDGNCGIGGGRMGAGIGGPGIAGGRMGGPGMGAPGMGGGAGLAGRFMKGGFGRGAGACNSCGMAGGNCRCGLGNHAPYTPGFQGPHGPSAGTYSYPYYTTRAPRDFLMANPPSIGR